MAIEYEKTGNIAWIKMTSPQTMNAFDGEMVQEFQRALEQAKSDDPLVLVLTGRERAFSVGGNIKLMKRGVDEGNSAQYMDSVLPHINKAIEFFYSLPFLTVASINGACAGAGLGLALHCDFRIAKKSAVFAPGFLKLAGVPDSGTTYAAIRLLGYSKALEFLLFSPIIDASKAKKIGLVHRVFPDDEFDEKSREFIEELAHLPKYASRETKRLLREALENPLSKHLEEERKSMTTAAQLPDHKEGVYAFLEKRPPVFPSTREEIR